MKKLSTIIMASVCLVGLSSCDVESSSGIYDSDTDYQSRPHYWESNLAKEEYDEFWGFVKEFKRDICNFSCRADRDRWHRDRLDHVSHHPTPPPSWGGGHSGGGSHGHSGGGFGGNDRPEPPAPPSGPVGHNEYCSYPENAHKAQCGGSGFRMKTLSLETTKTTGSKFVSTDERVIRVANKYAISHYAATYIVRALALAKQNDTSGISDLGLSKDDFKGMLKGESLSADKTQALSTKLRLTKDDTKRLVFNISNDARYKMDQNK